MTICLTYISGKIRRCGSVISVLLSLGLATFLGHGHASAAPGEIAFWLTILHNNDGESQLVDAGSGLEDFGGVARFSALAQELKAEAMEGDDDTVRRAVLMLSSGDNFLAGPEFNASLERPTGQPFYDTIALSLIGYDAICLGNHDFDFGPGVLARFIEDFDLVPQLNGIGGRTATTPPYLSANLDLSAEPTLRALAGKSRIVPSVVLERSGERIGVVGAITPLLPFISSPQGVAVGSVATAIQAELDTLAAQGVDKIILISHLQGIAADLALAPQLKGVDIMIAGGGDELLANEGSRLLPGDIINPDTPYPLWATGADGARVPVVTTTGGYRYLGRLVAGFDSAGRLIALDEAKSGPQRVAGGALPDAVEPDPVVQALVTDPVAQATGALAKTVIGVSQVALDGRRKSVRTRETNAGNLIADALLWLAGQLAPAFGLPKAEVAILNGGGIRNNTVIAAGEITEFTAFAMLPFPNFLAIVPSVSRDHFKELLEHSVSKAEEEAGRFAQIGGFKLVWDPAGTPQGLDENGEVRQAGTRIREVILDDGTPIVEDGAVVAGPPLTIATVNFLARGGDRYPFREADFTALGVSYQQALVNFIEGALGGRILAADYPEIGMGRITTGP